MTLPQDVKDREYQKFIETEDGTVALRIDNACALDVSIKDDVTEEQVGVTSNSLKVYPIETIEIKWSSVTDFNKGTHLNTQTTDEQGGAVTLKGGAITAYAVYHLNELSGTTIVDSSGNSRNGTTIGNPFWTAAKLNNGLNLTVSQYGNLGDIANFERTNPFSVECWIKTTDNVGTLIGRRENGGNWRGWEIMYSAGIIYFYFTNIAVTNIISVYTSFTLNDNNWHHIVITYNGNSNASGVNIYIDGSLKIKMIQYNTLTATTLNGSACLLGARLGNDNQLNGIYDEVIIYDIALTEAQVINRYNSGSGIEWTGIYTLEGTYTSNAYDSQFPNLEWKKIFFNQLVPVNTTITYKIRTSNDSLIWNDWSSAYSGGDEITEMGRYIQWKADLTTTNNTITPKVYDLSITYMANPRITVSP